MTCTFELRALFVLRAVAMGKRKRRGAGAPKPARTKEQIEQDEEDLMAHFVTASMQKEYPFQKKVELPKEVQDAIDWIAERTPEQVRRCRSARVAILCMCVGVV